jgi:RNA-binding protein
MPTGDLRRALRAHGHPLRPLVHVGKSGVTRGVLAQVAQTLFDHELIKVRIAAECPVDRFAVADELGAQPGTQVVQLLGRIVLVYKRHPQKPRFEGKATRDRVGDAAARSAQQPKPSRPKPSRRSKAKRRSKPSRRSE